MSTEAIRGGSEIIRGFANGRAGGRIASRVEELKRRTPLSIRPEVRLESAYQLESHFKLDGTPKILILCPRPFRPPIKNGLCGRVPYDSDRYFCDALSSCLRCFALVSLLGLEFVPELA